MDDFGMSCFEECAGILSGEDSLVWMGPTVPSIMESLDLVDNLSGESLFHFEVAGAALVILLMSRCCGDVSSSSLPVF